MYVLIPSSVAAIAFAIATPIPLAVGLHPTVDFFFAFFQSPSVTPALLLEIPLNFQVAVSRRLTG